MLERVRRKGSPLALLVGMYLIQTLWKMVWRFLKKLGIKPYDPAIPLLGIYPEETKTERHMCPSVHCSSIDNSQDTTRMSINRHTDKEAVVRIYDGILLSHKKEHI